jgi:hypothetical protein
MDHKFAETKARLADVDRKPRTVEKGIKKFQELPPSGEGTPITWT